MAAQPSPEMEADERMSIYRASRRIKRRDNSLYNALRSIYDDSVFVSEIAGLWPSLPLVANLRCGRWYSSRFDSTCYFKSTDGHANNWSFSTARLNLHLAHLAGQRGGCIIVDSTRKGKRFPDSMAKTIPIWCCVLNRAVERHFRTIFAKNSGEDDMASTNSTSDSLGLNPDMSDWDSSLHLPLWVPKTEKAAIEDHLEEWTRKFEVCGADIVSLASILRKPLRPLWISQKTVIWLNEVPDIESWDFTPVILVSASATDGLIQQKENSEHSWQYISGAGDDEESWAWGLSPNLFWNHVFEIIDIGPELCNKKVAEIVEDERVYRAHRGLISPQVITKPINFPTNNGHIFEVKSDGFHGETFLTSSISGVAVRSWGSEGGLFWISSTNVAVSSNLIVSKYRDHAGDHASSVLDCSRAMAALPYQSPETYLYLPMLGSKLDRFSLVENLPAAVDFGRLHLTKGNKLLVCCDNGEDVSVCVALAIVSSLFDEQGSFDGGASIARSSGGFTKSDMRRRLVFVCKFVVNARPSRGNLKQVFAFLTRNAD